MRYLAGNRVFNNESWIKLNIVLVNYRSSPSAGLWMQEKDNIHPSEVIETSSSLTSNVVQNRFIKSLVKANQWSIVYRYLVNLWSPYKVKKIQTFSVGFGKVETSMCCGICPDRSRFYILDVGKAELNSLVNFTEKIKWPITKLSDLDDLILNLCAGL